jgi:hypothetical protein
MLPEQSPAARVAVLTCLRRFLTNHLENCADVLPESVAVRTDATGSCRPYSLIQRAEKRGEVSRGALLRGTRSRDGLSLATAQPDSRVQSLSCFEV